MPPATAAGMDRSTRTVELSASESIVAWEIDQGPPRATMTAVNRSIVRPGSNGSTWAPGSEASEIARPGEPVATQGNRTRVATGRFADEDAAAGGKPVGGRLVDSRRHEVRLDPMARLENHGRSGRVLSEPSREALPFNGRNVAGVRDERDDRV